MIRNIPMTVTELTLAVFIALSLALAYWVGFSSPEAHVREVHVSHSAIEKGRFSSAPTAAGVVIKHEY